MDGNKRVAFATAAIFLRLNGYCLKVGAADGESFIVNEVIGKQAEIEEIASWLEARMSAA